jgi:hypothetical protein
VLLAGIISLGVFLGRRGKEERPPVDVSTVAGTEAGITEAGTEAGITEAGTQSVTEAVTECLTEAGTKSVTEEGTEFSTEFTRSTVYNLFNSRLMAGKPMIISTNMTIDEMINAYSQRFFSRVIGSCDRLDFIGEDVRQLKNT